MRFLFGEANANPNQRPTAQLRPTWLAIVAGRARPDEPEVVAVACRGGEHPGWRRRSAFVTGGLCGISCDV